MSLCQPHRPVCYLTALVVITTVLIRSNHCTADPGYEKRSRRALVFGAFDYAVEPDIPNTDTDTDSIANVLETQYQFHITRSKLNSERVDIAATRWINELANSRLKPEQVVVYYRGYLDVSDRQARLTGPDYKRLGHRRDLFAVAALAQRLSEIENCPQATVFLDVICDALTPEATQTLQAAVRQATGSTPVSIYAALGTRSKPTQTTIHQSGMSFWLADALRGAALRPAPSVLGPQPPVELEAVAKHVDRKLHGKADTVLVHSSTHSKQTVVSPSQASSLEALANFQADQMANQFRDAGIDTVVVPAFVVAGSDNKGIPGSNYGPLLQTIRNQFKVRLAKQSYSTYQVVEDDLLLDVLNNSELHPGNVRSPKMEHIRRGLERHIVTPGRIAVVIVQLDHGTAGGEVVLKVSPTQLGSPTDTASSTALTPVAGRAMLHPNEWAMIGRTAVNQRVVMSHLSQPSARGTRTPRVTSRRIDRAVSSGNDSKHQRLDVNTRYDYFDEDSASQANQEILELQRDSRREHVLADPDFKWRISFNVNGQALPLKFSEDRQHAYVEVQRNTTYSIGVENRDGRPVFLRLLVDGLNTLPDTPLLEANGNYEEAVKDPRGRLEAAQYASLTNARAWYCDPEQEYEIRGFFTSINSGGAQRSANAKLRTFVVTDARSSEAHQKQYYKDIGIITAAFYSLGYEQPHGAPTAALGTKLGEEREEQVDTYDGDKVPGQLLTVIHLRYGIRPEGKQSEAPQPRNVAAK